MLLARRIASPVHRRCFSTLPPPSSTDFTAEKGVKLNKQLATLGLCSRREAIKLINEGKVTVNGQKVTVPSALVQSYDIVNVVHNLNNKDKFTILLNKPAGLVSSQPVGDVIAASTTLEESNFIGRKTAALKDLDPSMLTTELVKTLAPCGRLDKDSTGLLILSNDGRVAKKIVAQNSTVEKEYVIKYHRNPMLSEQELQRIAQGDFVLDNRQLKPMEIVYHRKGVIRIVLKEGVNRQLRRIMGQLHCRIFDLKRVRIGRLSLHETPLQPGQWSFISFDDI